MWLHVVTMSYFFYTSADFEDMIEITTFGSSVSPSPSWEINEVMSLFDALIWEVVPL